MTPVFAHGHLRLYLLSLLADRPMHGYELIQALSDRFGGTYIPSAGTIYPRLAKLGEEGLVTRESDGRKTVYSITDAGRAELTSREAELDAIEHGVTTTVRSLADEVRTSVTDAMRTLRADLAASARERDSDPTKWKRTDASGPPSHDHAGHSGATSAETSAPLTSRRELHEAELALFEFRNTMRRDLRARAASASLTDGTASRLKEELEALRTRLG